MGGGREVGRLDGALVGAGSLKPRVREVRTTKKPQKDDIYEEVTRVREVGTYKKPQKMTFMKTSAKIGSKESGKNFKKRPQKS